MTDGSGRRCPCGEPLVEEADGRHVTVEGRTFPFSRATDFLVCAACGRQVRVTELHPPEDDPGRTLRELARPPRDPDG